MLGLDGVTEPILNGATVHATRKTGHTNLNPRQHAKQFDVAT
ncbi:hypothetical protein ABID19_006691 [Mesorhizobium robiniae]